MGIRVPRITVNADFGDDTAFGDLSLLSVGYGLHQAWVYAVMFGTPTIFGTQTYVTGMYGSHASQRFAPPPACPPATRRCRSSSPSSCSGCACCSPASPINGC